MKRTRFAFLAALLSVGAVPVLAGQVPSPVNAPASIAHAGDVLTASGTNPQQAADSGLSLTSETQNAVLAGPGSGGAGAPSFRALVSADIPNLSANYDAAGAAASALSSAQAYSSNASNLTSGTVPAARLPSSGAGAGSVTSVGLSLPSIFTVSGSPVTASGTLAGTLATQTANLVWAGPSSGSAAAPAFRTLVGADLPAPGASTLGGVESGACAAHQWFDSLSTAGALACAQPQFSDLGGSISASQLIAPTTGAFGGVYAVSCPSHQWIDVVPASGAQPSCAQPAVGDISGLGTNVAAALAAPGGSAFPSILGQSRVPFVIPSSGTMGANGALSGITAVAHAYPSAFCYEPAGAIATSSAAGWYYCTFPTTTTATLYNNTYVGPGTPAIPATPTAFSTTGPGAYTQTTGPIAAYALTIAGNTIGKNGALSLEGSESSNASANGKFIIVDYGSLTAIQINSNASTNTFLGFRGGFANRGATNAQVTTALITGFAIVASGQAGEWAAIDTTLSQTLQSYVDLANASDTMTLETLTVTLSPGVP